MFSLFINCNIANTELTQVKVLCKSAHMSCLDSAAHHTCVFPPPLLETIYEPRPNPVPFMCVEPEFVSPLKQVIALNLYTWNWRVL